MSLIKWTQAVRVLSTNNGSNYWKIGLYRWSDAALLKEINTSAVTVNVQSQVVATMFDISAIMAANIGIYIQVDKQGSPGD